MRNLDILHWVNDNKEWLLSGVGVVVITSSWALIKKLFFKTRREEKTKTLVKQNSVGSSNIQIGIQNNYEKEQK